MARRRYVAGAGTAGKRLDRFLGAVCSDLSRSRVQKLVAQGRVTVDGKVEGRAARALPRGAVVDIDVPEAPAKPAVEAEAIPLDVLFEDDDILVVNKPPGLVVHPAPGHDGGTLVNAVLHHCRGRLSGVGGELRPGIVHRLDRDTSGVIVVAKTDRAHGAIARQMKKRSIRKEYLALCAGRPKVRKGEITLAIGRDPRDRKRMRAFPQPKPPAIREATTFFEIEREWPRWNLSLLRLRLITGRTHQIRVHLAAIQCPVVGDPTYGKPRYASVADASLREALSSFPRQALHAQKIAFLHPATGSPVAFEAPVPADLASLVAAIEEASSR